MKIVIVHGAFGNPSENWFPWLGLQMQALGHTVFIPELPTPDGQTPDRWREEFASQVGPLTGDTILVGHSLGPAFILQLLENAPSPVFATFLVSGFLGTLGLPDFDAVNEAFVCRDFDWPTIKRNAGSVAVYNSNTDPYVPLERGRILANHLDVEMIVIENGGHVNTDAGFDTFPQLYDDLVLAIASGSQTRT